MQAFKLLPLLLTSLLTTSAFAQSVADQTQRNINQQQRIENGLQSGQLNVKEAAKLEREQAKISRTEARALKDGKLSAVEKERIAAMQDKASHNIQAEKHDAQQGNPNSASNQRMQADVQRNINQQQRIENGIQNGSLTNREVSKLEKGQARTARREAAAGADGHVGAHEQHRIQKAENRQSKRIHKEKHDGQNRG